MPSSDLQTLIAEVHFLKRLVAALVLIPPLLLLLGGGSPQTKSLKAEKVEIVDRSGRTVATIGSSETGGVLSLSNNKGQVVFTSYVLPEGSGAVALWDRNQKIVWEQKVKR
jgi:hypothetical protein